MTLKFGPARTDSVIIAGNDITFYISILLNEAELQSNEVVNALNTCIDVLVGCLWEGDISVLLPS